MVNDIYRKIGERVKHHRLNRGLSQGELAEGICSRQTISLLENGQHFPAVDFMKKIADRLSVPLFEIMVDESKELEAKVQLDIIKVYVETADYTNAVPLIETLGQREELLEYQRRELILCHAECLMRTGKADQAAEFLTNLQQRLELERESDDYFMATLYDKLGTANYFLSNMTYAHSHYLRAHQICKRFPVIDLLYSKVSYNLGNISIDMGHYSDALVYLTDAQQFFAKASDPQKLATTLFALGLAHHALNDLEQAGKCLKQALELFKSLNIMAMALRIKQQYAYYVLAPQEPELALKKLLDCAKEFKKQGDKIREANTYSDIASLYIQQERFPEAGVYLSQALSLFSEDVAYKDFRFAYIYRTNANYRLKIKEYDKAIEYAFKSADIFGKMGIERESANSLRIAVEAYQMLGHLSEALKTSQKVIEMLSNPRMMTNQI